MQQAVVRGISRRNILFTGLSYPPIPTSICQPSVLDERRGEVRQNDNKNVTGGARLEEAVLGRDTGARRIYRVNIRTQQRKDACRGWTAPLFH